MEERKKILKSTRDGEIDLVELLKFVWLKKWTVVILTSIFMVLGLLLAFTTPEEYTTTSLLIPEAVEDDGKIGKSLGGLASLAGVDLGGIAGSSQTINPALYQSISRSTPFLLSLMRQEYYFSEIGKKISLYEYFESYNNVSLVNQLLAIPKSIITWLKKGKEEDAPLVQTTDNTFIQLSLLEKVIIENLQSRVFVEMNWDLNVLKVEVEMQDPVIASEMVKFTQDYITNYVTEYAVSKSQQKLRSIEKQYEGRRAEFEQAQFRLASFRDKNQNVTTARARSEEERLQSEYNLAFNVYNQLAQQREAVRLQIQDDTPVFTILEPVKIPVEKSKPKRLQMLVIATILGGVTGVFIVLIKKYING